MNSTQMRSILDRLAVLEAAVLAPPSPSPPTSFTTAPDIWPLDPVSAATLVMRTIDDVDQRSDEQRAALLAGLLCAAWGSPWAQDH